MRPAPAFLVLAVVLAAGLALGAGTARGTWPSPVFTDNLALTATPQLPTEDVPVVVLISVHPALRNTTFVKGGTVYLQVTSPENVTQGPFPYPMVQSTTYPTYEYSFSVPAYPNGTTVRYYVVAWDFDNDVITSDWQQYTVQGAPSLGWRHPGFEENVEVTVFPPIPQPHEEVRVSIRSREPNVPIRGANLYLRYIYQTDPPATGGYSMQYVNTTHLSASILPLPPGTEVVFWVLAWDRNVDTITSPFYSYNLSVDKYTRHEDVPFPQVETVVGYSVGLALLLPVAVYFADARLRRRRP